MFSDIKDFDRYDTRITFQSLLRRCFMICTDCSNIRCMQSSVHIKDETKQVDVLYVMDSCYKSTQPFGSPGFRSIINLLNELGHN